MAISRIGSVTAATTSLTPTVGLAGDLMIAWAFRSTAATIPTVPTGWTPIGSGSGNTCAGVLAYHWCTATNDASGTWTGATQLIITKYRGVYGIGGIGTPSNATGTSVSYPALTAVQTAGHSWVVGAAGHRTASNVSTAPTGMTNVSSVGTGPQAAFHDTNGGVSSWGAQSVTVNASSGHESITVELLADGSTLNPLDKSATIALTSGNLTATGSVSVATRANVLATTSISTGKKVFEATINTSTTNPGVGFANSAFPLTDYLGQDGNSFGYFNDGYVGYNDTVNGAGNEPTGPSYTSGDVIQLALDAGAQIIWISKNGAYQGSPSAGTGGYAVATLSTFFPALQSQLSDALTVNFGATAFANAPPTGFTAWDTNSTTVTGTGSATLVLAGAGTGARGASGTAAATLILTGSASGTFSGPVTGTGSATLVLTGSATGARGSAGFGSATLILTGSAAGAVGVAGIGSATLILAGTATGARGAAGDGSAILILTGTGAGAVGAQGSGAGALILTGSGTGTVTTVVTGTGAATLILIASASGSVNGVIGVITSTVEVLRPSRTAVVSLRPRVVSVSPQNRFPNATPRNRETA